MNAEIIAIGTELLLGVTVDTNSAYLARQLGDVGVPVVRVTLVNDDLPVMVELIRRASERSELVICSGGLGPTGDDLTREAIAQALDRPLEFHQELLDEIAARFATFKRTMSPSNRQQAYVPQGAFVIRNPRGTAPAFVAEREGRLIAALPGVPSELKWLTEHALLPFLREQKGVNTVRVVREVHVSGLTEAAAGERIAEFFNLPNPVVGITAKGGQHTIRLAASANTREEAEALIAPLLATMTERFGTHLLADEKLEEHVGRLLAQQPMVLHLRETLVKAPVFQLLASVEGGRAALKAGSVIITASTRPLTQLQVEHEAQVAAQQAGKVASPVFGLAAMCEGQAAEGSTLVHLALSDGITTEYAARGFDLHIETGYDILAVSAVEMLRRRLERME
ncbi:MAG: CinA family nicotinamide mononucleotide deamidase-related protein [Herpetosiphonaceae bacterium]|nr:CinA family nicotinamide mononucleotide deamidase-related protein [Herpetosiphonaceae bacterium]